MIKTLIIIFLFLLTSATGNSQQKRAYSNTDRLQYGAGVRVSASFEACRPVLRISANAGIAYELWAAMPAYHMQLQLYNGGIGTSYKKPRWLSAWSGDFSNSLMLTVGGRRAHQYMTDKQLALRNSPLYYFSDFCPPPLQNPYGYSFSLGSNCILAWGRGRSTQQRTGFVNVHTGAFQFSYSNDGTPFTPLLWLNWGDGKDRYYTGDGFAAIHLSRKWEINTFMLSYHKFTGYWDKSFDLANSLYLANVDYKDTVQQYFNRSSYNLSVSSLDRGFAASFDLRNRYFRDVQHLIHLNDYWVLHQVPYRYAAGATVSYFYSKSYLSPKP
jgi:hypothetical protein